MGRLSMLEGLSLEGNSLEGMISEAHMSNLSKLTILGFLLRFNHINGSATPKLCSSPMLQVLDFSHNNISGMVPTCLNNLSAMVQNGSSNVIVEYRIQLIDDPEFDYQDRALLVWKPIDSIYKITLGLPKSIDLSDNNLSGKIPEEITSLLIGKIPRSFSQLSHLGVVNLSNNNFSGKIPSSIRLQTFEASAYNEEVGFITRGLFVTTALGFIVGFLGFCGTLLLNRNWTHAFFQCLNNVEGKLYAWIAVKMAKFKRRLRS
ncbi:hypothetical protein WN943_027761 [Citrus x changshan-huyou]